MKFLVFFAALGGSYALFDTFLGKGASALLAWPAAITALALFGYWYTQIRLRRALLSGDRERIDAALENVDPEKFFGR